MKHTIEAEQELEAGTSYWDCFKGANLRRTEISCVAFMCQQFEGTAITGNAVYFFTQAVVGIETAYNLFVVSLALSCVGVVMSWYLIYRFGRRSLYLFELWTSFIGLLAVATAATISNSQKSSYAQASIVICSVLIRFATAGPVCYAILAEISSVSLRSKTISIARVTYYISQIVCNTLQTYLISPNELNLKGKSGWVSSRSFILLILWAYFRLPETKGRFFEEIDFLFANRVPARKFRVTNVDPFDSTGTKEDEKA
ncbi:hypothetical protein FPRO04_07646 [Fusarium proliferatum]|uniref:Major facilitator superfamily (MFS) profile domain-containing protein n=1 Tax=Gibberella intermedia TaxID=948311 RepID=A0A420TZR5_GIBIN|nr:hypothetical protein FPRO04_07646 [Fusarium proliferatum]RKL46992.1 hypothetical protein BFJ72_g2729 [Fusarium proliferatum]